jgi:hypothetical protein
MTRTIDPAHVRAAAAANTVQAIANGDRCTCCGQRGTAHKGVIQCDTRGCCRQGDVIREARTGEGDVDA